MHDVTPQRQERWGVSILTLHWATAACVVSLLVTGWQIGAHAVHIGQRSTLLQWHASVGLVLLFATIVRLLVRLFVKRPAISSESRFRRLIAGTIQVALYLVLLALSVTGIIAAAPRPFSSAVHVFGIWPLPRITGIPSTVLLDMRGIHSALVWLLLALVSLHVVAAVYGTFIRRDGTLFRMLPWRPYGRKVLVDGTQRGQQAYKRWERN